MGGFVCIFLCIGLCFLCFCRYVGQNVVGLAPQDYINKHAANPEGQPSDPMTMTTLATMTPAKAATSLQQQPCDTDRKLLPKQLFINNEKAAVNKDEETGENAATTSRMQSYANTESPILIINSPISIQQQERGESADQHKQDTTSGLKRQYSITEKAQVKPNGFVFKAIIRVNTAMDYCLDHNRFKVTNMTCPSHLKFC